MPRRPLQGAGFPRRVGLIPPTRRLIEKECRELWKTTSNEQKLRWQVSYVDERSGKGYFRPVVHPDDIFGPDESPMRLSLCRARLPSQYWPPPGKPRDHAVVFTFLGLRWAFIAVDPLRPEKHIREDVVAAIPRLRKWAQERFPARKRTGGGMIYAWAFCYYHRLSGKTRAETAERVFGRSDRASMKRIDTMVDFFMNEVHPKSRRRPVE